MNNPSRIQAYYQMLIRNHSSKLESISEDHLHEIAYMLAGSLCHAEYHHNHYVSGSNIPAITSETVSVLIQQVDDKPFCKQSPLVLTAIKAYRQFALPQLGGYQTLCISDASTPPPQHINSVEITTNRPLANLLATANRCDSRILILLVLAAIALGGMFL